MATALPGRCRALTDARARGIGRRGAALVGYALGAGRRHLLFVGGRLDNSRVKIRAGGTGSGATDTAGAVMTGYEWAASDRLSLRLAGEFIQPNGVREVRITTGLFFRF